MIALVLLAAAQADPLALRAASPGATAALSPSDPSVGLQGDRWGAALTLHEATALAADATLGLPLHDHARLVVIGGLLAPVVAPGVGATAGLGLEAHTDRLRFGLTAPAAVTWTAVGPSTRLPVLATAAAAWPVGRLHLGLLGEAGWVGTLGGPPGTVGRVAMTVGAGLR